MFMARSTTTLVMFLSSPGDLSEEREVVHRVIESLNSIKVDDIRFEIWDWKHDALPGGG
jgi:hypothetical protein